jgi:hypothetical protein
MQCIHAANKVPLRHLEVEVWYTISVRRVIWSLLFHEAINSEYYARFMLSPLFDHLTDERKILRAFKAK